MHDIWNPWHGCIKKSAGCDNCYMYFLDKSRNQNGRDIYKVKNNFDYPLKKNKDGYFKIKSGEHIRVCMTSDFFLKEADEWREAAWEIMKSRPDVVFYLLTKRPERVAKNLPKNWDNQFDNISFNVTAENQKYADERIPILLDLPFKHKGVMLAPFIDEISLKKYLATGKIEQVTAGGENYDGCRPLKYEWVKQIYDECVEYNTNFCFFETGTKFIKDGKSYAFKNKAIQSKMAFMLNLNHLAKNIDYDLKPCGQLNLFGKIDIYQPKFREHCKSCGGKMICNGCSDCKKCDRIKE